MGSNWLNVNSSHGGGTSPVVGWWRHVPVSNSNVLVVIHLYRVNNVPVCDSEAIVL